MKPPRKVTKNGREKWFVDLREFGGGRRFCATEKEATKALARALAARENFGRLAEDMPHETRVRYLALERRLYDVGATIDEAVESFIQSRRPAAQKTIQDAIEECLKAKREAGRRERAVRQLGYTLNGFAKAVGPESLCGDVTPEQVQAWLNNSEWSQRTRKGRLIDLRTFISFCRRPGREWMAHDPTGAIEEIHLDEGPPGILTVPQVRRLLDATLKVAPRFLPFVALGVFCGVRPEEIKQLTWAQVNRDTGYVEIPAHIAKRVRGGGSRQRRLIKIQPNALEWLKLGGDLPPVSWQDQFDRVRRAAGFAANARGRLGKRRRNRGEPWPRNAMRHSFCSYCLPIFGELKESEWAGHSPEMAIARYRELVTEEAAREFWAITPQ